VKRENGRRSSGSLAYGAIVRTGGGPGGFAPQEHVCAIPQAAPKSAAASNSNR
jgi:hypothetical protein